MPILTEGKNPGEFLISEGNGSISRENIVIDSTAGAMVPGTVLGKMANGRYKAYNNANSAGDADVAAGLLYGSAPDLTTTQSAVMIARLAEIDSTLVTGLDTAARADMAAALVIFR